MGPLTNGKRRLSAYWKLTAAEAAKSLAQTPEQQSLHSEAFLQLLLENLKIL